MKTLTQEQVDEIKSFENRGDKLMKKPTVENCMDALSSYLKAQDLLVENAGDSDEAGSYGELKTGSIGYKVWHDDIIKKIAAAQDKMFNAKPARKAR